jgi:ribonucleoside-diphosphate reductase beta chain
MDIKEIVDCANDISKYYDELIELNEMMSNPRYERLVGVHKEALWMCLNAVNFLEGIRFYVSFACSWAFAELKKMEGNAKIIKFIARDENIHLASTQQLLKILPSDDADFAAIKTKCRPEVLHMVRSIVEQEKTWAKYLFKEGSVIGLNERLLCNYVEWIADKRLAALSYHPIYGIKSNPLPWTQKWIAGGEVQVAPQETEITSYVVGGVKKDISSDTFKGFKL